jgi:dTDP-glucose pyrophosphorylase
MRAPDAIMITSSTPIEQAIRLLDEGQLGLALVCDERRRLLGIVTDVDVRKGLLRSMRLDGGAIQIMNPTPLVATPDVSRDDLVAMMHRTGLRQIPIVDHESRIVGVEILKDLVVDAAERPTEVIVMAGGRGRRMGGLTDTVPKPMLPVGGRPLLEILVERLRRQGFVNVTLAIRYLADVIEEHFGDGTRWGVRIRYVREADELGTAGALYLINPPPRAPFVVINGDLVTELNFQRLVDYHEAQGNDVTVCAKHYQIDIAFGVLDLVGQQVSDIREKPSTTCHVNAGIYTLDPSVLGRVEGGDRLDMTDLIRRLLAAGGKVGCFPLRERWLDIGTPTDYRRAETEFADLA